MWCRSKFSQIASVAFLSAFVPATYADPSAVGVNEVNDYSPAGYTGTLAPSPPHADGNPRHAVIIQWSGRTERFIFSHEASYCPILELPGGAAMSDQFFEGNLGEAELMNSLGRRERNSFVDILERGPSRGWVRWTYFAVNMKDDSQPRLRGTEDYFAFPNGLILRRASYRSLMPDQSIGYSTQPVELFGIAPLGASLADLFQQADSAKDFAVLEAIDLYTSRDYKIWWSEAGKVRREGDDATLEAIAHSRGFALILPFRGGLLFAILGEASGFPSANSQLIDHCTPGARGGAGWGAGRWDHWPVGWLNSQGSDWKAGSPYPWSFGSIGHFLVPAGKRIDEFWKDYSALCANMEFNRWTERRQFCVLLGRAVTLQEVREVGRAWLDMGDKCQDPASIPQIRRSAP